MPVDASIYQNVKTPQIEIPSPLDSAQKAMTLSQLGMQQRQMQLQMQNQQAMAEAYRGNVDANGNINHQGVLSALAKTAPLAAMEYGPKIASMQKSQAEAQSAQMDAQQKIDDLITPHLENLKSAPDDQKPTMYHAMVQKLAAQGVPVQNVPPEFNAGWLDNTLNTLEQRKSWYNNQKTQAETGEAVAKTREALANAGAPAPLKVGAEELGKFNEDVNNASSRKTTGSLIDARTRADRILSLLNSGAPKGESQAQRIGRLNQYMPQIGTEIGTSLAAIMQGGIPNESLQEKLAPDTINSHLATLQQKWKAEPTAANQGALLDAYGDIAKKLRDFSADQLHQVTSKARAAYPFANKYYGKEMDKIGSQIDAPASGGGTQLASDQISTSSANAKPAASAGDTAAMKWLKTADPTSPEAFAIRAKLKKKGLL